MRCKILLAFFCFAWVIVLDAQTPINIADTTTYSLQVPKKWNDSKFLYLITGFIAKNIPLLKDKKVCMDCASSPYEVTLVIVPPKFVSQSVTNVTKAYETKVERYEYAVSYSFMASLDFTEKLTNGKQKIILIDSVEKYDKSKVFDDHSKSSHKADITDIPQTIDTRNNFARTASIGIPYYAVVPPPEKTPVIGYASSAESVFDPEKFKQEHERAMKPNDSELITIVRNRVSLLSTPATATVKK
jgi:hypothetical protein